MMARRRLIDPYQLLHRNAAPGYWPTLTPATYIGNMANLAEIQTKYLPMAQALPERARPKGVRQADTGVVRMRKQFGLLSKLRDRLGTA